MATENTFAQMAGNSMGTIRMGNYMDMVSTLGLMDVSIKVNT
jgi:hypothetical protein